MGAAVLAAAGATVLRPVGWTNGILPACALAFTIGGTLLSFLRLIYARVTRLTMDAAGVELRQPFRIWRAPWKEIAGIRVSGPFDPVHRGGVAAGVWLRLRDGTEHQIPDVLAVPRRELAQAIGERSKPPPAEPFN